MKTKGNYLGYMASEEKINVPDSDEADTFETGLTPKLVKDVRVFLPL